MSFVITTKCFLNFLAILKPLLKFSAQDLGVLLLMYISIGYPFLNELVPSLLTNTNISPGSNLVSLKKESNASAEKCSVLAELTKQNT